MGILRAINHLLKPLPPDAEALLLEQLRALFSGSELRLIYGNELTRDFCAFDVASVYTRFSTRQTPDALMIVPKADGDARAVCDAFFPRISRALGALDDAFMHGATIEAVVSDNAGERLLLRYSDMRVYRVASSGTTFYFLLDRDVAREYERALRDAKRRRTIKKRAKKRETKRESPRMVQVTDADDVVLGRMLVMPSMKSEMIELRSQLQSIALSFDPKERYRGNARIVTALARIDETVHDVLFALPDPDEHAMPIEALAALVFSSVKNALSAVLKRDVSISRIRVVGAPDSLTFNEPVFLTYACLINKNARMLDLALPYSLLRALAETHSIRGVEHEDAVVTTFALNEALLLESALQTFRSVANPQARPFALKDDAHAWLLFYELMNAFSKTDTTKTAQILIANGYSLSTLKHYTRIGVPDPDNPKKLTVYRINQFNERRFVSFLPPEWKREYEDARVATPFTAETFIEGNRRLIKTLIEAFKTDHLALSERGALLFRAFALTPYEEEMEREYFALRNNSETADIYVALSYDKKVEAAETIMKAPWFVYACIDNAAFVDAIDRALSKRRRRTLREDVEYRLSRIAKGEEGSWEDVVAARRELKKTLVEIRDAKDAGALLRGRRTLR